MDEKAFSPAQARPAPHVESVRSHGGVVHLMPATDLRIRVHTGEAVRGFCHAQRFIYEHGDVDVIAPGQAESWIEDGPARSVVVRFSPRLIERTADDLGLPPGRGTLGPRHKLRDAQLAHIAWALEAEREAGSPNGRLYAESLGTAMALQLLGRYSVAGKVRAGMSAAQLRRVQAHIEVHLDGDLSLPALAAVACSSTSHFKVLFRRTLGMPVHEYVMRQRVERARALLTRGGMPASEVALVAGFAHQSHMARQMRRVLGITPRMLRTA